MPNPIHRATIAFGDVSKAVAIAFLALAAIATTARRDRVIVVLSSCFLAVAVVEWTVGQWVS